MRNYGITYAMRPLRNFKTNQCCHLISRIANRAFFLNDEGKTRFVERLWRVATFSWGLRGSRGVPVLERLRKEDAECYFIGGNVKSSEVRTYREFYDRFLAWNNLTHILFHALRHTFATRCIEAGGDCMTVSELLGHSTVNLTLNLYGHPQMAQKRQCVESLSY